MKIILYTISNLKRSGPTLVLYGLVKNTDKTEYSPVLLTLSEEKENSLKPQFDDMKIPFYCLGIRGIKAFILGGLKFRKLVKKINPAIIHANGFRDIVLTSFFAPKKYKKCATIHCDWFVDYALRYGYLKGKISALLQMIALRRFDKKIACSKILADLLNKKFPSISFDYVDNGVDTDRFYPVADKIGLRKKLNLVQNKKIIIWAGEFIPVKNPLQMAEVILTIPENKYFFVFCGARGVLLEKCKEVLQERKDVLFTGYITNIEEYYRASDIYVSTSLSEGLPLAGLEAQFCGLLPLLSNISQHKYILPESVLNFCIYNTKEELASKLTGITDDTFKFTLAECGKNIKNFSAAAMSGQYKEIYDKCL